MMRDIGDTIDLDDPDHVEWLYEWALQAEKVIDEKDERIKNLISYYQDIIKVLNDQIKLLTNELKS